MSCERYEEKIALAAGGDLDAGEQRRLDRHLAYCPACRAFAEEMRQSRGAVRRLARVPIGDEVFARVRAGVFERAAAEAEKRRLPPRWLAAAAVLVVALGAALWQLRRGAPEPRIVERTSPPVAGSMEPPSEHEALGAPPAVDSPSAVADLETPPPPEAPTAGAAAPPPAAPPPAAEPLVIRWVTDDPDVVIYWLVDSQQATEETRNEISEV